MNQIDLPHNRQSQIIAWLREETSISVKELAKRLNVSTMTIHRDLNKLVTAGHVEKVHGGAVLTAVPPASPQPLCNLCGGSIQKRTAFLITLLDGAQRHACCPHCGLLILQDLKNVGAALITDFLYGRRVNAYQAYYVIESSVTICCVPSTLAFASDRDAARFQTGFGGNLKSFEGAIQYLITAHAVQHENEK